MWHKKTLFGLIFLITRASRVNVVLVCCHLSVLKLTLGGFLMLLW